MDSPIKRDISVNIEIVPLGVDQQISLQIFMACDRVCAHLFYCESINSHILITSGVRMQRLHR
jgi:hypothetical protein